MTPGQWLVAVGSGSDIGAGVVVVALNRFGETNPNLSFLSFLSSLSSLSFRLPPVYGGRRTAEPAFLSAPVFERGL